jgi:RHS repeat-associated protein
MMDKTRLFHALVQAGALALAPLGLAAQTTQPTTPSPAQKQWKDLTAAEQRDAVFKALDSADRCHEEELRTADREQVLAQVDRIYEMVAATTTMATTTSTYTPPGFANGFTGHEQTDPSGLIYMQARFYAPWYGKFLSPDPKMPWRPENPQTFNLYTYVLNDPTMLIDPDGLDVVPNTFMGPLPPGTYHAAQFARMMQSRSSWGASAPNTGRGWERDPQKTRITVHDTGESGNYRDMKSIQDLHMEKGLSPQVLKREFVDREPKYNDIGYHFGIGADGTVFQGRDIDIKGSHVGEKSGGNTGNIGIVILDGGDGSHGFTPQAAEALKNLLQYLKIQYPDIKTDIKTHGERNAQGSDRSKSTTEAEKAKPVIDKERQ